MRRAPSGDDNSIVVGFLFVATLLIGIAVVVLFEGHTRTEREKRRNDYIAKHHCERIGFAGQYATSVYRCDNGMFLETEIDKELR